MGFCSKYFLAFLSLVSFLPVSSPAQSGGSVTRDSVSIHPGWPISRSGSNERGGIFCNLDQDDDLEIVFTVGNFVYAFNMNGSSLDGWPVELNYPTDGAAAFGDIDGDGMGEVVVTTHQPSSYNDGKIYALKRNGSNAWGFPVTTVGGPLRSPVLADLDQDGAMEIIVAVRNWPEGFIHVYKGNGTMYPGWPVRMDYIPASAVAAGDITGDEFPEIISESYYSVHAYNANGTLLAGWPFTPGNDRVFSYSSPVLADIDNDGLREIIFGDHSTSAGDGKLYILKNDGTSFPGWPKTTSAGIYSPPAVGDIDGNGQLDVVVGEYGFNFGIYKLYAWTCITGYTVPGFPIMGLNSVNNQVILADLDGDDELELMFDDNTSAGVYLGYNHDGTPMEGWPLHVNGTTFYINPFVADLNGDGLMEICGGSYVPAEDKTYIYLWDTDVEMNADLAVLPVLQYNTRHNGVAGDYLMVGVSDPVPQPSPSLAGISITPNPATDHIDIHFDRAVEIISAIELYDMTGSLLQSFPFSQILSKDMKISLRISWLKSGTYLLRIPARDACYSARFIISE